MVGIAKDDAAARLLSLKESMPSSSKIERWGNHHPIEDWDMNSHTLMAAIYEAVGMILPSINIFCKSLGVFEELAGSVAQQERLLAQQQRLLKRALTVGRGERIEPCAAHECEGLASVRHSVLQRDLRFLSVSQSYSELFDFSQSEFESLSLNELLHPLDRPRFYKQVTPLLDGSVPSCELVEWRVTGSHSFVLSRDTIWAIGADQAGAPPRYIASVSEKVTDKEVAEALAGAMHKGRLIDIREELPRIGPLSSGTCK